MTHLPLRGHLIRHNCALKFLLTLRFCEFYCLPPSFSNWPSWVMWQWNVGCRCYQLSLLPFSTFCEKVQDEEPPQQCVRPCLLSRFSHVWLFVTLWTVAHQALLSMGFSKQEYWRSLLQGIFSIQGLKLCPESVTSPALAGRCFTTRATWEAPWSSKEYSLYMQTLIWKDISMIWWLSFFWVTGGKVHPGLSSDLSVWWNRWTSCILLER